MKIDFTNLLFALSDALDAVEIEYLGSATGHGRRVAFLTMKMMAHAGITDPRALTDISLAALLHDNGLSAYLRQLYNEGSVLGTDLKEQYRLADTTTRAEMEQGKLHSEIGEQNIRSLPFRTDIRNIILWHHENADGSGALGVPAGKTNLASQVVHLTDTVDVRFNFTDPTPEKYDDALAFVLKNKGRLFTDEAVSLFEEAVPYAVLAEMKEKGVTACLREGLVTGFDEFSDEEVHEIADFFARIVDYKSSFTKDHSMGVGAKAEIMARFYEWPAEKVTRYYFAGAMHDIGKMMVPNDILEKPDRLTPEEFGKMQNHAAATRFILAQIPGMEDITEWAANHHEKLDGSGYSLGLTGDQLSFEERLMGCVDIYQALTEKRPYKEGLPHEKAIAIMRSMAKDNKIDAGIVEDVNEVFGGGASVSGADLAGSGTGRKWKCPVCGFIWEGDKPPENCPVCDAPGYRFEPVE